MKKFTLLAAVAALATAGGVFAAWTYAEGNTELSDNTAGITISVDTANDAGALGTFAKKSSNLEISFVNPDEATVGNYDIEATVEGSATFTYTSSRTDVDEDVSVSYALAYELADGKALPDGVSITVSPISADAVDSVADLEAATHDFELANTRIAITVTGTIETRAKYNAFKTAVEGATWTLTASAVAHA